MIRVVIDTNLYVSAMINRNSRQRLDQILKNQRFDILIDKTLVDEFVEVIHRPKFKKYVVIEQIEEFINLLYERCTVINTTSKVSHSPDPKDDFLLALALDGASQYLITGNKIDLLDLKQYGPTSILSLTQFLEVYFPNFQSDF
ncbi:putative toxin-antitoxin system toxin component, PIN family [Dyadobacter fanqingshengii]|nr:putative toxin-antitoxin system toxin component, PIN family [Dyadobacter fanqingshengii]